MPTFAITLNGNSRCTWDTKTGEPAFHQPASFSQKNMLVLEEEDKVGFEIDLVLTGKVYRILIGDIPYTGGRVFFGNRLVWEDYNYFESARGRTNIVLQAQPEKSEADLWEKVFATEVYVLPSKLGEDRYQLMTDDLQKLSRNLLVDLYGKSKRTQDIRYGRKGNAYQTAEQELKSIRTALDNLVVILCAIRQRPASRVKSTAWYQNYWGGERLTPGAVNLLARRGMDPSRSQRPLSVWTQRKEESFDIPEHRTVRAVLDIITGRAKDCAEIARCHIKSIDDERRQRPPSLRAAPTIEDRPKIKRLKDAIQKANHLMAIATTLKALPFLCEVRPELVAIKDGTFQRSREYIALLAILRQYLLKNALWSEGDEISEVTKLTSTLFEQWCYLQIVEAFRSCGLELGEWSDALRQNLQSRFVLNFESGLLFEGALGEDLRIRFRYTPRIPGAIQTGETLYHESSDGAAWRPDIVIECLRRNGTDWSPVYVIVLDCKYRTNIIPTTWGGIDKYMRIRSCHTKRQIVRQLWLISPGNQGAVSCKDFAVHFSEEGPSCAPDETLGFSLLVAPGEFDRDDTSDAGPSDPFHLFAKGTINFLRKHF